MPFGSEIVIKSNGFVSIKPSLIDHLQQALSCVRHFLAVLTVLLVSNQSRIADASSNERVGKAAM